MSALRALTGRPPFQGESPVAVAYQHVRENPAPPSSLNPDVTPPMDAVVMKALAKNPDNRYQSATEMRADVQRAMQGVAVFAPAVLDEAMTQPMTASSSSPPRRTSARSAATSRWPSGSFWYSHSWLRGLGAPRRRSEVGTRR